VAKRGRPAASVVLTEQERDTLQRWARRPKSAQALAQRCRIVLGCAAGKSNKDVAAELGVSKQMVCKWRVRSLCGDIAPTPICVSGFDCVEKTWCRDDRAVFRRGWWRTQATATTSPGPGPAGSAGRGESEQHGLPSN
jgi:DNA-binding CsgD family transcriptional regulator